jgi:hypothetical protein
MMADKNFSRRTFIRTLAVAIPAGTVALQTQAQGADLPQLDPADPVAMALVYVHDAADVDKSNPLAARFEVGQTCDNCAQIQGNDGDEWRPCGIFPGKSVAGKGWCSVWVAMP